MKRYVDYTYSVLDLSDKLDKEQLSRQIFDVATHDPSGGLRPAQVLRSANHIVFCQICLCAQLTPIALDMKSFCIAFPVSEPHIPIEMSQTMMILMMVVAHELY